MSIISCQDSWVGQYYTSSLPSDNPFFSSFLLFPKPLPFRCIATTPNTSKFPLENQTHFFPLALIINSVSYLLTFPTSFLSLTNGHLIWVCSELLYIWLYILHPLFLNLYISMSIFCLFFSLKMSSWILVCSFLQTELTSPLCCFLCLFQNGQPMFQSHFWLLLLHWNLPLQLRTESVSPHCCFHIFK